MVFPLIYTPPVAPRDSYQDQALDIPALHGGRGATQPRGNVDCEARSEEKEGLSSPRWDVQHRVAKEVTHCHNGWPWLSWTSISKF